MILMQHHVEALQQLHWLPGILFRQPVLMFALLFFYALVPGVCFASAIIHVTVVVVGGGVVGVGVGVGVIFIVIVIGVTKIGRF